MFFRKKKTGDNEYLQIVENRWEDGKSKQRVLCTLGRLDQIRDSNSLESLLVSGSRFTENMLVLGLHKRGEIEGTITRKVGPSLIFERLWRETGCQKAIARELNGRKFSFPVERAIFLTVLHRLFDPGSDRAADKWKEDYRIEDAEELDLHHFYRAMAWLGEELGNEDQLWGTVFSPRCRKDNIEEAIFEYRRDMFSGLDLVFMDTTSIYFEGEGGETLGEKGFSKDSRPDLNQMVVAAVLDDEGRPVCCEMWPGNTADVNTLIPVADRLEKRFHIRDICIVADRGMISSKTIKELEKPGSKWKFILGARMRRHKEVRDSVLSRGGRYQEVRPQHASSKDVSPLKVKEVWVGDRRYIVCMNEQQARKDAFDRQKIVDSLQKQLKEGDKSLVGNKGYRKFLKAEGKRFSIDEGKIAEEARYDGKWVLSTNTELPAAEVALKYKQLWMVEDIFRSVKSLLETRPIFHKRDETIRGHVFCSFLALILRKEMQDRLHKKQLNLEWKDIIRDLDELQEVEFSREGRHYHLRTEAKRTCGKVFQAVGVALPPTVR